MEQETQMQNKKLNINHKRICKCGGGRFKQEVKEIYDRYLDREGNIIEFEDELTHDFEFGKIRCVKCGIEVKNVGK